MKFLNCQIDLSKWAFMPRIETEFWVKSAIKEIKNAENTSRHIKTLDIFAGSGCIGTAVLKNIKNSKTDFSDVDKKAIEQIKINLRLNRIPSGRYKIYQSNLFKKLKNKRYDFIFANPPYLARDRIKEVQPSVLKQEPKRALFAGKKGMFYIRRFLREAKKYLNKRGIIFMEFDPLQKAEIEIILKKEEYKRYKFFKDQFKKYRWVKIP